MGDPLEMVERERRLTWADAVGVAWAVELEALDAEVRAAAGIPARPGADAVTRWCAAYAVDAAAVEDLGLAVVRNGWLVLPLHDAQGRLAGITPVSLSGQAAPPAVSLAAIAPPNAAEVAAYLAGHAARPALHLQPVDVSGRVLADPLGRLMLSGELLGDGTPTADLLPEVGVWIVEGPVPWLRAAAERSDADSQAPAVLGLPSAESWTQALAERIPDGCRVTLATGAGAERRIGATLEARAHSGCLRVERMRRDVREAA
jgi:hypothetical protein